MTKLTDSFPDLALTPEDVARHHAARSKKQKEQRYTTDPQTGQLIPSPIRSLRTRNEWHRYHYWDMLELAKSSRNALLATWVELNHLRFRSDNKNAPIEFGSVGIRSLGFRHQDKTRALKTLVDAKLITVEWRKGESPLITFVRPWHS